MHSFYSSCYASPVKCISFKDRGEWRGEKKKEDLNNNSRGI
jgi:hypothetical protein